MKIEFVLGRCLNAKKFGQKIDLNRFESKSISPYA